MKKTITVEKIVKTEREIVASDFSDREIPPGLGWSTITKIWCEVSDISGNKHKSFNFDLLPEEMADFRQRLGELVAEMKRKWRQRVVEGGAE